MSSVAAPPAPPARSAPATRVRRAAARTSDRTRAVAGLVLLVAVSAVLRTRAIDAGFWIDEALSVGIASYDLGEIFGALRRDGAPPLYYLLLHGWMELFGTGEIATHVLSVLAALVTIPVAWWAARSLFGERVAWIAALLTAINPFLTFYAQETRMYTISALLGLLVATTFLHAFVNGDRRWLPAFVAALTTMLYTHNWAIFLGSGTVVALGLLWRWAQEGERRRLVRDGLLAYGVTGLLYLPWVPTLLFQAQHTGAPWAERPSVDQLFGALGTVLGGMTPAVALLLVAGSGLALLVGPGRDRRVTALVVLTSAAVLVAFVLSQLAPAFATRYLAAFAVLLVLIASIGIANAGRLGLACLVLIVVFWLDPRTSQIESKSNTRSVAGSIQPIVNPGDLVVSTQPETLPLLAYYLSDGVRYADALGPVADARMFDWTDALSRLRTTQARPTARALVGTLRPGQELVLVVPVLRTARWGAPWTKLVRKRSVQFERALDADGRVRREAVVPVFGFDRLPRGVRAIVYRRR